MDDTQDIQRFRDGIATIRALRLHTEELLEANLMKKYPTMPCVALAKFSSALAKSSDGYIKIMEEN